MKRFAVSLMVLSLAACSNGGGSAQGPLPQAQDVSSTLLGGEQREAQSDASRRSLSTPVPTSDDLLYVANTGNNSITVYPHDVSGDTAPKYVISGAKTGIVNPGELSEDASGNLYVANNTSILVFAHGANGNVAPIRTIAGSATGLTGVTAVTVDQTTGKIFAVAGKPTFNDPYMSILRFPPNASGNEAPFATSVGVVLTASELALDSTGTNVIAAHTCAPENCSLAGIDTFAKQFANHATPAAPYTVTDVGASGLADDPPTKTYLVSTYAGIYRLAENTTGYGPESGSGPIPPNLKPAIVSTITSDVCGQQLALGYLRNIYVTHRAVANCTDAVYVYMHDASGNATPLRILKGSATKLDAPYGIYEGK